ncbi:hypothetical protein [Mesorhizobium loti]|uniref:hypothetical protein n=1 Tax=Rhizobium loti TaxID=381 RepID=UPI0004125093|nr:hypothetical protein [Mesorhizobium loti]
MTKSRQAPAAASLAPAAQKNSSSSRYQESFAKRNARLLARFWISNPGDGRLDVISDINELLLDEFRKNNIRFA